MKGLSAKISVGVVLSVSAFSCMLTLVGYVGSFRYLEIFSDYRPFLLGLGSLCLLPAILLRKNGWDRVWMAGIALSLTVIIVNGLEVLPWLLARKQTLELQSTATNRIKAVAFNVEGVNTNYSGTRAFVEREAPDIVMFCECSERWSEELRGLTNRLPYRFRNDAMDIEMFSRYPLTRTNVFHFGPNRGFIVLDVSIGGREFGFVATHTYPRHWLGAEGFRWRTEALEQGLGRQLNKMPTPLLVMGDLNASPWSPAYKQMMKSSRLQDARRGHGLLVTQHGHGVITRWLWRPIDHCLYSSGIEVVNISTGPDLNSDHLPLVVDVQIKQE